MKGSPPPAKHRHYDAAFHAETLRLAAESRSTQAVAFALNIAPKRIYKWQKEALTPIATAGRAELATATATELCQLRALARRQAQELDISRIAIAIVRKRPIRNLFLVISADYTAWALTQNAARRAGRSDSDYGNLAGKLLL